MSRLFAPLPSRSTMSKSSGLCHRTPSLDVAYRTSCCPPFMSFFAVVYHILYCASLSSRITSPNRNTLSQGAVPTPSQGYSGTITGSPCFLAVWKVRFRLCVDAMT